MNKNLEMYLIKYIRQCKKRGLDKDIVLYKAVSDYLGNFAYDTAINDCKLAWQDTFDRLWEEN